MYGRSLSVRFRNQMTRSGRMDPAGIADSASRNPLRRLGFAVETPVRVPMRPSASVPVRKTVQVGRRLPIGHRLSLSHNLRPDGISRNAGPSVIERSEQSAVAFEAARRSKSAARGETRTPRTETETERSERDLRELAMPSRAGTRKLLVQFRACKGCNRRGEGRRSGDG